MSKDGHRIEQVAAIACVIDDGINENSEFEIDDLLEMGVIEHSEAPYASPLVLVKKPDNTYRVCVNFKELNKITVFDPEPMMSPDDIFQKLAGSKIYSLFDFCKGYYGIPMQEESKDYTTFVRLSGLMRFKVMPFGTCGKFRLHI